MWPTAMAGPWYAQQPAARQTPAEYVPPRHGPRVAECGARGTRGVVATAAACVPRHAVARPTFPRAQRHSRPPAPQPALRVCACSLAWPCGLRGNAPTSTHPLRRACLVEPAPSCMQAHRRRVECCAAKRTRGREVICSNRRVPVWIVSAARTHACMHASLLIAAPHVWPRPVPRGRAHACRAGNLAQVAAYYNQLQSQQAFNTANGAGVAGACAFTALRSQGYTCHSRGAGCSGLCMFT